MSATSNCNPDSRWSAPSAWASLAISALSVACLLPLAPPASGQDEPKPDEPKPAAKSSDAAVAQYARAVRVHNNRAYEVAEEEWTTFLKQFPEDPLAPKARYYLGVCHLQNKSLEKAAEQFQTLTKDPKFELIDDARFNLGWVQYTMAQAGKQDLFSQAADTFAALVEGNPKSGKADQALYFHGECLYALGKREEAAALYARVVSDYPKSKLRCDALYAQGVSLEEAQKYPRAGEIYDQFIASCADSNLLTEVRMRKAETVLQAGQYAEAAQVFGETAAVEDFPLADHAVYRQAFCYAKLDKMAEAGKTYAELCEKFPKSTYVPAAQMGAGRSFYKAQDNAAAAQWLDKVIAAGGVDSGEAAHWRCRIHLAAQQADEAGKLAATALARAEGEYVPYLKLDKADAAYADPAQRADAVKQYEALAKEHADTPVAPQALYYAAFGSLELKNYAEAERQAAAFLDKYPEDALEADVRYVLAESRLHLKKYPEAEQEFARLASKFPDHADHELWTLRQGVVMLLQKKYAETAEAMQAALPAVKTKQGKAEAHYLIGSGQFFQDQFAAAAASLQESLDNDPKWRSADETMLLLGRCQAKQKQNAEAAATIVKLLEAFPQTALAGQAHYRLAEVKFADGKLDEAVAQYDKCLEAADPAYAAFALYGKGWTQLKLKQYGESETTLTAMLDAHAEHSLADDARFARGMARRQAGKHQEAVADLEAFLQSEPPAPQACDAMFEKGLAQVALKKLEDALATFQAILEKKPDYAAADNVLYEIGWAHKSLGKEDAAVEAFAKLAETSPDSPHVGEAHYHVGESLYAEEKYAEAAAAYEQARDKSKKGADIRGKALFKLGWSRFQQAKYDEAAAQFAAQRAERPDGPLSGDATFMQGESLFRLKNYEEALPIFEQAAAAKVSSPAMTVLARLHAGQCAAQQKQWEKSLELLEPIPEQFPDTPYLAEAVYERGWARQNLGAKEEAMADYKLAAEKGRDMIAARARFMMGELLFEKKDYDEAVKQFQRVMFFFGDEASDEVKNWQAKAGYEAGRCSDVQIKDEKDAARRAELIADAKKFYGYVVQKHPGHELAAESKKRLEMLAKL